MTETKSALEAIPENVSPSNQWFSGGHHVGNVYKLSHAEIKTIRAALSDVDGLRGLHDDLAEERKMRKEYFLQTCAYQNENTRLRAELAACEQHVKILRAASAVQELPCVTYADFIASICAYEVDSAVVQETVAELHEKYPNGLKIIRSKT